MLVDIKGKVVVITYKVTFEVLAIYFEVWLLHAADIHVLFPYQHCLIRQKATLRLVVAMRDIFRGRLEVLGAMSLVDVGFHHTTLIGTKVMLLAAVFICGIYGLLVVRRHHL